MTVITRLLFILILTFSPVSPGNIKVPEDVDIHKLWLDCGLEQIVAYNIFNAAVRGKMHIDNLRMETVITIIDFTRPSVEKRFFVIDLENKQLLFNCLVAHGKNSGDNYAKSFSNEPASLCSSLGFYVTAETYYGEHGYSLRLDGLEKSINDNARARDIVIHGAEYVSEDFIKKYGRLGRSWGCPALPPDISKKVIDKIASGSCVYIYGDDKYYRENSAFMKMK